MILYEYPFNERIRTYLRLEHLFVRLGTLMSRDLALDHHFALTTIFEVMDVAARADLKSDVLKDLDRQKQSLNSYRGNPAIAESVLDKVVAQLDHCFTTLSQLQGKAGLALSENEWLMSIRSRANIPGGTCEFDLPAYYAWQHRSAELRRADLYQWSASLSPLADAIQMLLRMLRDSGVAQKVAAPGGQFQLSLPQGRSFQLMRLAIDEGLGLVPEISGNRLLLSVRLMRQDPGDHRLHASTDDTDFEMTLCA